ncbi:hypothetical protein BJX63DRAFT_331828 [Aspergillus granulosus]|uniref:Uncharacterized protein n=1 Tax=Aspergillus granulosus TaxID=176169 RepID=A0ABR4H382_9EURO
MGRREYLNRLALGRSPYEAPEPAAGFSAEPPTSTTRRISPLHADGYVQHYDERGHPVNPESKSFGKELRRAKNDILSTMGIVVSEDANRGRNEQQKIDAIVAENDYGLIMVTLDQISVFLGSWWTTSLTSRIQTFRSYTHTPIMRIMSQERASLGTFGFYFAGVPAWAVSTCLSICRHHPLERLISTIQNYFPNNDAGSKLVRASFTLLHTATRGILLVLAMQTYMYSLLQSLHLIHPASFPGLGYFMPLGEFTSILLPSVPSDFSVRSFGAFALNILKTPSLFYIYVYLKPFIEVRLYRLIRRRLPKPSLTDDLSIKVAFDNDLIDWMVPNLGRRGVEETLRSKLSLTEDLLYEAFSLWQWVSSKFTFRARRGSYASDTVVEQQPPHGSQQPQPQSADLALESEQRHQERRPNPTDHPTPIRGPGAHYDSGDSITLSNEENQVPNGDSVDLLRHARNLTLSTRTSSPDPEAQGHGGITSNESRRASRSDTLHSGSSSPASLQSSPRVRTHVISDSDVIAMQLELGSRQPQGRRESNAAADTQGGFPNAEGPAGRRSVSELLDTLLSNDGRNLTTIINSDGTDSDGLSHMTAAGSPDLREPAASSSPPQNQAHSPATGALDSAVENAISEPGNILPDVVEEPPLDDTTTAPSEMPPTVDEDPNDNDGDSGNESDFYPSIADSSARQNRTQTTGATGSAHRVTILSALPVDSLASHLSSMVTTALFAPLEAFYLRSLASSYISATGASGALCSDIYGLGVWGGGPSGRDRLAYMGKLALMFGLQAAVNTSVWGVISGTAIRIGRRWCGWGAL